MSDAEAQAHAELVVKLSDRLDPILFSGAVPPHVAGAVLAELTASWIIKHIDSGGDPATTVMIQDGKLGYFVGLVCGLLETQRKAEEVIKHPAGHA